jgi:hypothetical protein
MRWLVILLCLLCSISLAAEDVEELLDRSDEVIHPPNLQGSLTFTLISRRGDRRVMKVEAYQKSVSDKRENRLFMFTFPPSVRGTGLLVHSYYDRDQDRMWIYLPEVAKIKRVNLSSAGGGYFMGSDFTYSDLISANREDFNYELVGEAAYKGDPCYLVRRQGKTRDLQRQYGYSKDEHYIRKSDLVPVRIVFYDLAGDLLKELSVQRVAEMGPYRYPSHVTMENLQNGHKSIMECDTITAPEHIPDDYFTHRYLMSY